MERLFNPKVFGVTVLSIFLMLIAIFTSVIVNHSSSSNTIEKLEEPQDIKGTGLDSTVKYVSHENSSEDNSKESETRTTGKTGSDWNTLNDNEKFHAVSNALYNLDQAGYTITEGEYEFIDALDVFYSDEQNSSVEVSKALVQMGLLSGAIFK